MRYHELVEGIEDKGIFKGMFLGGMPGAGKSTVIKRITDGAVSPRIVNTDKAYEFMLKKHDRTADAVAWQLFGPLAKTITAEMLFHYLNGMLPLFIDGTSNNVSAVIRRRGLLHSIGYDTALIWVNVDLDTALARVEQRERKVDPEFIKSVYEQTQSNKELYRGEFGSNFIEVDNNGDNFSQMETKTYASAQKFFNQAVQNSIGQKSYQKLRDEGQKYLVPTILDEDYLKKLISIWYMR